MPVVTKNIATITIDGSAFAIPTGTTYVYQESGHGTNQANAVTVSTILQDEGDADGRTSGNSMCDPLPNQARNNQGCYHTHANDGSGDQVFFNWAWTSSTAALAITTKTLKHA